MRIGEVARSAGVTVKAVRYYESLGLVRAGRLPNGYREYDEAQVHRIREIRTLGELGITAERTRPFLDCLDAGRPSGDDCPASLDTYREAIADMTHRIAQLGDRRDTLADRLAAATARTAPVPRCELVPEEIP
ncbi:MerR family transcriptional regulator [Nocardioides sp. W7]|uniref:MerR family transcriptional regulator n=1 Tax=Nocardioides sp. W7 TaxID=2931390 RepID=UPI001FD16D83|nr:MerR family transcriptional regulator [Nocardioides sp. W7]